MIQPHPSEKRRMPDLSKSLEPYPLQTPFLELTQRPAKGGGGLVQPTKETTSVLAK